MRRGFNTLAARAEKELELDPYSGHLFVFRGRRGDLLKIIWWDQQGACLFGRGAAIRRECLCRNCCVSFLGAGLSMRRPGSCGSEELADEPDLAADVRISALDAASLGCSDRFEPAQCCFG